MMPWGSTGDPEVIGAQLQQLGLLWLCVANNDFRRCVETLCPIALPYDQRYSVVLSDRITTVAVSRSDQQSWWCNVADKHTMMCTRICPNHSRYNSDNAINIFHDQTAVYNYR
jgi:hypothetical protein